MGQCHTWHLSAPASASASESFPPPPPSLCSGFRPLSSVVVKANIPAAGSSSSSRLKPAAVAGWGRHELRTLFCVGLASSGSVSKPLPDNASRRNQRVAVSCSLCDQQQPLIAASRRVQGVRILQIRISVPGTFMGTFMPLWRRARARHGAQTGPEHRVRWEPNERNFLSLTLSAPFHFG